MNYEVKFTPAAVSDFNKDTTEQNIKKNNFKIDAFPSDDPDLNFSIAKIETSGVGADTMKIQKIKLENFRSIGETVATRLFLGDVMVGAGTIKRIFPD